MAKEDVWRRKSIHFPEKREVSGELRHSSCGVDGDRTQIDKFADGDFRGLMNRLSANFQIDVSSNG